MYGIAVCSKSVAFLKSLIDIIEILLDIMLGIMTSWLMSWIYYLTWDKNHLLTDNCLWNKMIKDCTFTT